jgi:hypothetical protein
MHIWKNLKARDCLSRVNQLSTNNYSQDIQSLAGQGWMQVSHGPEVDLEKRTIFGLPGTLPEKLTT